MKTKTHKITFAAGLALLAINSTSAMAHSVSPGAEYGRTTSDHPAVDRHRPRDMGIHAYTTDKPDDDSMTFNIPSTGESVFNDVSIFKHEDFFSRSFQIDVAGKYLAALTDFQFPKQLIRAGINITTSTESLGMITAPGYFTFDADPGNYFVSFFGKARHLGQYGIDISMISSSLSAASTSPVPVPGAVWLFGSGLLGLAGVVRRKPV